MDRAQKIAQLRKDYTQANIDNASLTSTLESKRKQKLELEAEARGLGVEPENIDTRIKEAEAKIDSVIAKMDLIKSPKQEEAAI